MPSSNRVGIIGCGMIAGQFQKLTDTKTYSHAKAISENEYFGEIGFYDRNPERAHKIAHSFNGRRFGSIEELLTSHKPLLVSICSPDNCHFEQISILLDHPNCPEIIFVEKPVCKTVSELDRLKEKLVRNPQVSLFVNHSRRFDERHVETARAIRSNALGQFTSCRMDYYGGWEHNGIHLVDFILMCFDNELDVVNASYGCFSKYPGDETIHLSGNLGTGKFNFRAHDEKYYQITETDLFFENGRVLISDFGQRFDYFEKIVNDEVENVLMHIPEKSGVAMQCQMSTAYAELRRFLQTGELKSLENVSIGTVEKVMRHVWKVKDTYAQLNS
ncbi:MAG: Gfo/Idh/MocA family oxidoreductase [Paracoccaceae bacterium]|nr:Gfo/Idh/MocA family oxidoreductase [Paracoccaceae bacterium]